MCFFKQEQYNSLYKWMNHKWDFIVMQAKEQYRWVTLYFKYYRIFMIYHGLINPFVHKLVNVSLAQAYTALPKKHTLIFHLTAFNFDYCVCIRCCIAPATLYNTTFISIKSCIRFWPKSIWDSQTLL